VAQDDWMLVGRIVGAFGVKGQVKVEPLTDFPDRFTLLKSVFLGKGREKHAVLSTRRHTHVLLGLSEVTTREAAQGLRGSDVWIPRSEAMKLPEGEYYVDDIIGLDVETDGGVRLGAVRDVLSTGANDVYVVGGPRGELLVPAIRDVVRSIDVANRRIVIHPLPGLLD
jgi:16S rRNA processing protein RimM